MKNVLVVGALVLLLGVTGCASAADPGPDRPTTPERTYAPDPPAKSRAVVVRVYKSTDGSGWPVIGLRKDGETSWTSFACNDGSGICFLLEPKDHIAYSEDYGRINGIEIIPSE